MKKVSVIIPVYNLQEYIGRCMDSVLCSTYQNIEVLVVDDGSTDGTGAILDVYAARDARVRVMHSGHKGMSLSRNLALDEMTGDYVTFVDGDDWVMPDYVESMVKNLEKYDAEISAVNYVRTFDDGRRILGSDVNGLSVFNRDEAIRAWMVKRHFYSMVWCKLFKAELVSGIRFPDCTMSEDLAFFFDVIRRCNRLVWDSHVSYCYYYRDNSLVNAPFDDRYMSLLYHYDRILTWIAGDGKRFAVYAYACYIRLLSDLHRDIYSMPSGQERQAYMRTVRRKIRDNAGRILVNREVRPVKRITVVCQGIPGLDRIAAWVLCLDQKNKQRRWAERNNIGKKC